MFAYSKTTGRPINGTSDTVPCTALIQDGTFNRHECGCLGFEWEGTTDIEWNDQRTNYTMPGEAGVPVAIERLFMDDEGHEVPESDIVLEEHERCTLCGS